MQTVAILHFPISLWLFISALICFIRVLIILQPGRMFWAVVLDHTYFFYFGTTDFLLNDHTYIFCVFVFIKSVDRCVKFHNLGIYNKKLNIFLSFFLVNQIVFISSYLIILSHKIHSSWVMLSISSEKHTIFVYRRDVNQN